MTAIIQGLKFIPKSIGFIMGVSGGFLKLYAIERRGRGSSKQNLTPPEGLSVDHLAIADDADDTTGAACGDVGQEGFGDRGLLLGGKGLSISRRCIRKKKKTDE